MKSSDNIVFNVGYLAYYVHIKLDDLDGGLNLNHLNELIMLGILAYLSDVIKRPLDF